MSALVNQAQRLLFGLNREWGRQLRAFRHRMGIAGTPWIMGLDGWAAPNGLVLRARVLESHPESEMDFADLQDGGRSRARRLARRFRLLYRRYATVEVPEAHVEVLCGGVRQTASSDDAGFVLVELQTPDVCAQRAEVRLVGNDDVIATPVPVYTPGPNARHVVVSDIDDTVLDTDLSNPFRRFAQLLLSDRPVRLPFAGVGELYRAFTRAGNPIFYVSNSPTNLHGHLRTMFEAHGLPAGPLLLQVWGVKEDTSVPPRGRGAHKDRALRRIATDYPHLPMILVGDTTRRDSQHYLTLAEEHPGRVSAIYIRKVGGPLSWGIDGDALARRAARAGVRLMTVDSALEIAVDAERLGFLTPADVESVRAATEAHLDQPSPFEELAERS